MRSGMIGIVVLSILLFPSLPYRAAVAGPGDRATRSGEYRTVTFYVA